MLLISHLCNDVCDDELLNVFLPYIFLKLYPTLLLQSKKHFVLYKYFSIILF